MPQIGADLLIDVVVGGLLAVTLVYCVILERRLAALRSGQDGLKKVVADLNAATQRAEAAIGGLRHSADACAATLHEKMAPARALADELSLMLEAGDNLAHRLAHGRAADAAAGALRAAAAQAKPAETAPPAAANEKLLRALKDAR